MTARDVANTGFVKPPSVISSDNSDGYPQSGFDHICVTRR